MNITISGPGGIGLRGLAERMIREIRSSFLISVTTTGTNHPLDMDFDEVLVEVNAGKADNRYGNVTVLVNHQPWGG